MYLLYSLLLGAWIVVMLPFFVYKAAFSKKYLPKLRERMGRLPDSLRSDGRPTIWFHSCSVGETLSVQPLAHLLHEQFPGVRLVFSVITQTGRKIAEERFRRYGDGNVFYLPIDEPVFVNKVLGFIRPDMLIFIDTEIWPNLIHEARKRNVPVFLANGRISAQSFQYYRWLQPLLAPVLANYERLLMKSEEDAERIRRMGAGPSKVRITGNIKYDRSIVESAGELALKESIRGSFGFAIDSGPVIVAGSTHEREEEVLFDVLTRLRQRHGMGRLRLLIAPRHPERFDSVAALARRMGHGVARRTDDRASPDASVLLLDTVGELATAYSLATVAVVGGTLIPFGGQSIMEPALHGKAIVIGPSMDNFPSIIDDFIERGAICRIPSSIDRPEQQRDELVAALEWLLTDEARRDEIGVRAQAIFEESRGATQRTLDEVAGVFRQLERVQAWRNSASKSSS